MITGIGTPSSQSTHPFPILDLPLYRECTLLGFTWFRRASGLEERVSFAFRANAQGKAGDQG